MSLDHVSRVRRLYKLIFRLHRGLTAELRVLGNNYARDEFKRHKKCTPVEANIFLNEWTVSIEHDHAAVTRGWCDPITIENNYELACNDYALNLAKQMKPLQQAKKKVIGQYLDPQMLEYMTDEQLLQLYELHKAASLKDGNDVEKSTGGSSNENNNTRQ